MFVAQAHGDGCERKGQGIHRQRSLAVTMASVDIDTLLAASGVPHLSPRFLCFRRIDDTSGEARQSLHSVSCRPFHLTRLTALFVPSTDVVNNAVDNLHVGFKCFQRFDGAGALQ